MYYFISILSKIKEILFVTFLLFKNESLVQKRKIISKDTKKRCNWPRGI